MTRIFTDGAEMQDLSFWSITVNASINAVSPFVSPYSYQIWSNGAVVDKYFSELSELYCRFRIKFYAGLSTNNRFPSFRTTATDVVYLANNGIYQLQAVGSWGTTVSALVLETGKWYLFEIYFKEADAPSGRLTVKVDGNIVIDVTGDTKPAGTTVDNIFFTTYLNNNMHIDDLALNDTAGLVDNSWCGDGVVVKVEPDGNGTHNSWHGSDADDVDNYQMCHEFPKDDDTTYVYHDNTAGIQQQFAMSHLSFTGYTILRIWAEARARKTAAVAMTLKLGQLAAGGADVVSAGRALYIGSYNRVVGDDSLVNPVDTNPWEEADIDAIEFVAEVG